MTKRFAAVLAAFLVATGFAAAAPSTAGAQDSAAVAVNLKDGAEVLKFAFKVVRVNRDVVDQSNAAVAYANCEACRTIAVAFQIVLVMSDPQVVTPENVALAVNYECESCETLASAYQFVFSVPEGFRFSGEAKRQIAEIRQALRELIRSGRPIEEIHAEIDVLADELRGLIRAEIDRFEQEGKRPRDDEDVGEDEAEDELDEETELEESETTLTETTEEQPEPPETTETTTETVPSTTTTP
jgi:putative peptide zinc metalloprotease protein